MKDSFINTIKNNDIDGATAVLSQLPRDQYFVFINSCADELNKIKHKSARQHTDMLITLLKLVPENDRLSLLKAVASTGNNPFKFPFTYDDTPYPSGCIKDILGLLPVADHWKSLTEELRIHVALPYNNMIEYAIYFRNIDLINVLIETLPDELHQAFRERAINFACLNGDIAILKHIMEKLPINAISAINNVDTDLLARKEFCNYFKKETADDIHNAQSSIYGLLAHRDMDTLRMLIEEANPSEYNKIIICILNYASNSYNTVLYSRGIIGSQKLRNSIANSGNITNQQLLDELNELAEEAVTQYVELLIEMKLYDVLVENIVKGDTLFALKLYHKLLADEQIPESCRIKLIAQVLAESARYGSPINERVSPEFLGLVSQEEMLIACNIARIDAIINDKPEASQKHLLSQLDKFIPTAHFSGDPDIMAIPLEIPGLRFEYVRKVFLSNSQAYGMDALKKQISKADYLDIYYQEIKRVVAQGDLAKATQYLGELSTDDAQILSDRIQNELSRVQLGALSDQDIILMSVAMRFEVLAEHNEKMRSLATDLVINYLHDGTNSYSVCRLMDNPELVDFQYLANYANNLINFPSEVISERDAAFIKLHDIHMVDALIKLLKQNNVPDCVMILNKYGLSLDGDSETLKKNINQHLRENENFINLLLYELDEAIGIQKDGGLEESDDSNSLTRQYEELVKQLPPNLIQEYLAAETSLIARARDIDPKFLHMLHLLANEVEQGVIESRLPKLEMAKTIKAYLGDKQLDKTVSALIYTVLCPDQKKWPAGLEPLSNSHPFMQRYNAEPVYIEDNLEFLSAFKYKQWFSNCMQDMLTLAPTNTQTPDRDNIVDRLILVGRYSLKEFETQKKLIVKALLQTDPALAAFAAYQFGQIDIFKNQLEKVGISFDEGNHVINRECDRWLERNKDFGKIPTKEEASKALQELNELVINTAQGKGAILR